MRLQNKISLLIAVMVLLSGIVPALISSYALQNALLAELNNKSLILCQSTADRIAKDVMGRETVKVYDILQSIVRRTTDLKYIYIIDFEKMIFAHTFDKGFPEALLRQHPISQQLQTINYQDTDGSTFTDYCLPLIEGLSGHLHVGVNTSHIYAEINALRRQIIIGTFLLIIVGVGVGTFLCRRFTLPLKLLSNAMKNYGKGGADPFPTIGGGGCEINDLSQSFTEMVADKNIAQKDLLDERVTLRESEEKYRKLANEFPDLRYRTDNEGTLVFASQSFHAMTGYAAEEVIGMKMTEFYVNPEERELFLVALQKHGYVNDFIVYLRRKDGSTWWASINTQLYKDQDGNILGVDGVVRDVTEQKNADKKLRRSEERFRSLTDDVLDTSTVGIFILDSDFRVVWVNQAIENYFGLKRDEIIGKDKRQLIREKIEDIFDNPDDFENKVFTTYDDNTYVERFECHILADGEREERWLEHRSQPIQSGLYAGGRIEHYYDISDIKQAQNELLESELKFREMANLLPQVVYESDIQGNLTFLNEQAYNLFGYSQEDVDKGLNFLHSLVPEDRARAKENINNIVDGKPFENVEYTAIKKDGLTSPIMTYTSPIIKDRKIIGLRGIIVDISEQKKMEEELLKVRKLESVGVLAGGIAHDFNNILVAILGNISLALMTADPKGEIYELLVESEKASLRAKDLTQQLLTFAKGGEPVKKIAAIDEIIRDSANFVLRGNNVRCDFKFGPKLWPVAVDTGQISQVIQNIIINASQAMPTGGTIAIDCSNYCLESSDVTPLSSGNYIKIVVKDQGVGIPADMLDKIFDPYFTTKQKGSGLGLAIIHSIISKHDGYITADSELGQGTTFTIYLPASQDMPKLEPKAVVVPPANVHGRIMVMDDEEMIRSLAEKALSRSGYEVVLAADGNEAVLLYQKAKETGAPIDLIIMDLTIPGGMGGKEAIKEIHKIDPEAKVIVSSGYSNDPVMTDFGEYGFCGVTVKPFQIRELLETVGRAVSR